MDERDCLTPLSVSEGFARDEVFAALSQQSVGPAIRPAWFERSGLRQTPAGADGVATNARKLTLPRSDKNQSPSSGGGGTLLYVEQSGGLPKRARTRRFETSDLTIWAV